MPSKILLVDDDPLVLRSFQKLLTKEGYEVYCAASYDDAMNEIKQRAVDLVISDIRMPGKDGVSIVSELQKELKATGQKDRPIIFITGYADYGRERHAEFLGETLYKPVDSHKLLQTIRDYL